jgi:hypothetical protein
MSVTETTRLFIRTAKDRLEGLRCLTTRGQYILGAEMASSAVYGPPKAAGQPRRAQKTLRR